MSAFTPEEIAALYAPFPLEAHTTREGHKNRAGTKIQWFTYLDRAAVQRRLETLFPGEWSIDILETHREADYVTVSLRLTIRGISRSCNGGQSLKFDKDTIDEDKEKGAWTEAFRRVASVWGIGLYLYEMDYAIWTNSYENGDWDQQRQRMNEAKSQFADWYSRQYKQSNGARPTPPPAPVPSQNGNGDGSASSPTPARKVIEIPQKPATPKGKPAAESDDISKWEHWTPLMANDTLKKLYPDGAHRGNVIKLLKRHGAFKDGSTYSAALWRIQSYAKMRADHMSEEDAVAATISLPDALEGLEA